MAAPSVGRRSCAGQREAAALITQSRRWSYGRVKRAAGRRLFFFAVVRQLFQHIMSERSRYALMFPFFLIRTVPRHSSCKTGYYMTNQYRNPNPV